jgi:hypothetical protein
MAEDEKRNTPGDTAPADDVLDISLEDLTDDGEPEAGIGAAVADEAAPVAGPDFADAAAPVGGPVGGPGLPAVRDDESVLEITAEDLLNVDVGSPRTEGAYAGPRPPVPPAPPIPGGFPGGRQFPSVESGGGYPSLAEKKPGFVEAVIGATMLQLFIAGAIGGFLAWLVTEPFISPERALHESRGRILLAMASFGAALGGCIGAAIGSAEGLVSVVWQKALRGMAIGLVIGGAGGGFGGFMGQALYAPLGGGRITTPAATQVLLRALAWGIVGLFVGLGEGASMMASRKIVNGLVGGAVGGFVGGLLFDPIGAAVQHWLHGRDAGDAGAVSRLIAMVVMGACTGAAIGLVEQLRKEAWLRIVYGPLAGKEFILYKPVTLIGSAPGMDIPLVKDPHVAPKHCSIEVVGATHAVRDLGSGAGTIVAGRSVTQQALRSGDVIQIGTTGLQYEDRAVPRA